MKPITSELVKRFGLAMLGQALPKASALSAIMTDIRRGLLATIVTGVLIAAFLLLGCLGFYQFMISEGLSNAVATILSAGLLFLLSIIIGLVAEKYTSKAGQIKDKLALFANDNVGLEASIESLLQAFIEGLFEKEDTIKKQTRNEHGTATQTPQTTSEPVDPVRH